MNLGNINSFKLLINRFSIKRIFSYFYEIKSFLFFSLFLTVIMFTIGFLHGNSLLDELEKRKEKKNQPTAEELAKEYNLKLKFYGEVIGNEDIAKIVLDKTKSYEIDPSLVVAIMKVESDFNPFAENRNTNGSIDRGLMQLNNNTFKKLQKKDFYDPETNIKNGIVLLDWCLRSSGNNIIKALAFYNAGYGKVTNEKVGEMTLDYINKVLLEKYSLESRFDLYKMKKTTKIL